MGAGVRFAIPLPSELRRAVYLGGILKTASIVFAVSILASSMPVAAHHSYDQNYLLDKTITVVGTIVLFDFRNPHSFLILDVKGTDGKVVRTGFEWSGRTELGMAGITAQTLKSGDKVTVKG